MMNSKKLGQFIAELRKAHNLTQRQLADSLSVTDKAVSKWERGLSCPDIGLLSPLAALLGVTVGELLNGEREGAEGADVDETVDNALQYAKASIKVRQTSVLNTIAAVFSAVMLLGVVTCSICDLAITGGFTWSVISISSIAFCWLIFFPALKLGPRGAFWSLVALSVLVVPYLAVLNSTVETDGMLLRIGLPMSAVGVCYLWADYAVTKLVKGRYLLAGAVSLFLVIPVQLIVNGVLSGVIGEAFFDVWDAMSTAIVAACGLALLVWDRARKKK